MNTILVVEDDVNMNEGICLALKNADLAILQSHDLKSARSILKEHTPDLVLLDVNLPDGNGLEILKEIKKDSSALVILLTANDTELDVVKGLESGADDYITKPFSLAILRARVNTQLRRLCEDTQQAVKIKDYIFDFEKMQFTDKGNPVELSKTEQKLLRALIDNKGITMSRDRLLERVWGDSTAFVDENALSVTVKRLRDKLNAGDYIKTVYGLGYVWVVK